MHHVTTATAASTAALTVGLAAYAALIFAGIAVALYDARRHLLGLATAAAVIVGVLTLAGLAVAIASSVA